MLLNFYKNHRIFVHKLLIVLIAAALILLFNVIVNYVGPFILAYVISIVLGPIVGLFYNRFGINRGISSAFLIVFTLALIALIGTLLVNILFSQIVSFASNIPTHIENLENLFYGIIGNFENILNTQLDIDFNATLGEVFAMITNMFQAAVEGGQTVNFLAAIPHFVLRLMLTIISAFFFIKDKELISNFIKESLPKKFMQKFWVVRKSVLKALYAYAKGQFIIMVIVSSICIIGLTIIGSPYSLLIGLGIGLFDIIPILGAGGILVPWALYSFLSGNFGFGIGLLIIYGVLFITRQIIEPKIVANKMGIHPIILLMSIYLGLRILGPFGIILGPLTTIALKTILEAKLEE